MLLLSQLARQSQTQKFLLKFLLLLLDGLLLLVKASDVLSMELHYTELDIVDFADLVLFLLDL